MYIKYLLCIGSEHFLTCFKCVCLVLMPVDESQKCEGSDEDWGVGRSTVELTAALCADDQALDRQTCRRERPSRNGRDPLCLCALQAEKSGWQFGSKLTCLCVCVAGVYASAASWWASGTLWYVGVKCGCAWSVHVYSQCHIVLTQCMRFMWVQYIVNYWICHLSTFVFATLKEQISKKRSEGVHNSF